MSKIEKRIEKWRNPRFKQNVPVNDIYSVLNLYFPESWSYGESRGSHIIRVWHKFLVGHEGFGPEGDFTIPTTGGKHIKHFYLKTLVKAIDILKEYEK